MRQDGKQRGRLECVVRPALTRGAPDLEEITQTCTSDERQHRHAVIRGGEDEKCHQPQGTKRERFIQGGVNEAQHQGIETPGRSANRRF